MPKPSSLSRASWIWLPGNPVGPNQYACFRKTFSLGRVPAGAQVSISADSDFVLYVNGVQAGRPYLWAIFSTTFTSTPGHLLSSWAKAV